MMEAARIELPYTFKGEAGHLQIAVFSAATLEVNPLDPRKAAMHPQTGSTFCC